MPKYTDNTDRERIKRQIEKKLANEKEALDVLDTIHTLCLETEIATDFMSQWLGLLSSRVPKVQKLRTSTNQIEIYPSGSHGRGGSDRLIFQVGAGEVEVIEAGISSH